MKITKAAEMFRGSARLVSSARFTSSPFPPRRRVFSSWSDAARFVAIRPPYDLLFAVSLSERDGRASGIRANKQRTE